MEIEGYLLWRQCFMVLEISKSLLNPKKLGSWSSFIFYVQSISQSISYILLLGIYIIYIYILYIIYIYIYYIYICKRFQTRPVYINKITNYFLLLPLIYLYLVALLHFFYDDVGVKISHSAFSLCTIFKPNWNKLIIMIIMITWEKSNYLRWIYVINLNL